MVVYTDLGLLTSDTQNAARQFLARLDAAGLNPKVLETYRTQERQDAIYRTNGPGSTNVKTNTLHSWHTAGRALDVQISRADIDSILFFLDTAESLGFKTVPGAANVHAALDAGTAPNLWDWHHVSFRGGRSWATAANEYTQLLSRGPHAPAPFLSVVSNLFLIGALVGLFYHGKK